MNSSTSRCVLLVFPKIQLSHIATWLVPGISTGMMAAIFVGQMASGTPGIYKDQKGMCVMAQGYENYTANMTRDDLKKKWAGNLARGCTSGLPVIPIGVSFVLSMVYLKRANVNAENTGSSSEEYKRASVTVILVTFLYLICNFPIFLYFGYLLFVAHEIDSLDSEITFEEYDCLYYRTYFDKYYAMLVVTAVLPAINSALNPAVYFWRMLPFRRFVLRQWRVVDNSLPGTAGSNEATTGL